MTDPAPSAAPPRNVVVASWLCIASAVLGLIGLVVSLVLLPQTLAAAVSAAEQQSRLRDTGGVDVGGVATAIAAATATIAGLIGIAVAVLTIVFARKLLRGRNWARIVLTVFAGLHLLSLIGIAGPAVDAAEAVLTLLSTATLVVGVILLWLRDSRPWFQRRPKTL